MNLREQAVYKTGHDMWAQTGGPVSADAIAEATGFDDQTTQQILKGLDAKGYFVDALRGDDRIDSITYA
ncbi:MarR family transcriptional regulator [Mycobacterium avium]